MKLLHWLTGNRLDGAIDIASPEFKANPFPYYAKLRAESPVVRVKLPDGQFAWLIARYDDVVSVLKDERFAKDKNRALTAGQLAKQPWMPGIFRPLARNMLDTDPPDHARLRALVNKAFTPRLVEQMRGRIEALTNELLDRVSGRMDLIQDYALPVPTTIIAEILGVPVADRHRFHRWSTRIVTVNSSKFGVFWAIPAVVRFVRYIRRLIQTRRAEPRDDLISALIQSDESGARLSEDELVAMVFLLLVAGHETTVNLIGNGVLALLENPAQLEKLRSDPGLIRSAIEELLRFTSPVETATERYTREDVTVAGVTIPQGSLVLVALASANRDAAQFPDPDTLNITREPNRHVAFGLGPHFCVGAPLARLEAQVAINTLLLRCPSLRLETAVSDLRWRRGLFLRGLLAMRVKTG